MTIPIFFLPEPERNRMNRIEKVRLNSEEDDEFADVNLAETSAKPSSFCERLCILLHNSCFMILVLAGSLRFFGGYSLGFLSAKFYEDRFPEYST